MNELISICVPVYNTEKYLCDCIRSIQKQSYSNIEVLFNDDGSTDNSYAIIQQFAQHDKRIIVQNSSHLGPAGARNVLINNSKGNYILFIDSDDIVDSDYVMDFVNSIRIDSMPICGMSVDYINEGYSVKTKFSEEKLNTLNDKVYYLDKLGLLYSPCNKLYDKKLIDILKLRFNENMSNCEDLDFNVRYLKNIKDISIIPKSNYHYRKFNTTSDVNSYRKDIIDVTLNGINLKTELYNYFNLKYVDNSLFLLSTNIDVLNYCLINTITYSRLRNRQEIYSIIEFVFKQANDLDDINKFAPNNLFQKIFLFCYKTHNINFTFILYNILLVLRHKFKSLYGLIRKKQFKKN